MAIAKTLPAITRWILGLTDNGSAKEQLFGHLYRGMTVNEFRRLGVQYISSIEQSTNHYIMDRLRWHQSQGHRVIIVSASMPEWIAPWASRNGIDTVIGTEPESNAEGILTGRFATPNCYGVEKVRRVRALITDIGNRKVWAYGDSDGDNEMLALADYPKKI